MEKTNKQTRNTILNTTPFDPLYSYNHASQSLVFLRISLCAGLEKLLGLLDIEICELRTQLSFIQQQLESVHVSMETSKPFPFPHYEHRPFYQV